MRTDVMILSFVVSVYVLIFGAYALASMVTVVLQHHNSRY